MNGFAKPQPAAPGETGSRKLADRYLSPQTIGMHGHDLRLLARKGLRQLFVFVAVSALFFHLRHTDLLAPFAEHIRQVLGCPPPAPLTTLALAGYSLSAGILLLTRTAGAIRPSLKWSYLGYRLVFYLFYSFSNSLDEHFLGVFVAGLLLFGLEQMNIATYSLRGWPRQGTLPG